MDWTAAPEAKWDGEVLRVEAAACAEAEGGLAMVVVDKRREKALWVTRANTVA